MTLVLQGGYSALDHAATFVTLPFNFSQVKLDDDDSMPPHNLVKDLLLILMLHQSCLVEKLMCGRK